MPSPNHSIVFWAPPVGASTTIAVGDVLIPNESDSSSWEVATTASRNGRRSEGVAVSATGGSGFGSVEIIQAGTIDATTSGLAAGSASWVRCSATGAIERFTPSAGGTSDVIGYAEADGRVHLLFGALTEDIAVGGAITGTGTRVLFFDGADNPAGDAGFTYNKTTDTATLAGGLVAGTYASIGAAPAASGAIRLTGGNSVSQIVAKLSGSDRVLLATDDAGNTITVGVNGAAYWTYQGYELNFDAFNAARIKINSVTVAHVTADAWQGGLPRHGLSTPYASEGRESADVALCTDEGGTFDEYVLPSAIYSRLVIRMTDDLAATGQYTFILPTPANDDASYVKILECDNTISDAVFALDGTLDPENDAVPYYVGFGNDTSVFRMLVYVTPEGVFELPYPVGGP